jgi:ATP-dependent Clp protease adaptor protein ClpS
MRVTSQLVPRRETEREGLGSLGPLFRVLVHNDDRTPMDFVTHVLGVVFEIPQGNAEMIMYTAHLRGIALVRILPAPEARRRVAQAHFAARLRGFPLTFSLEPT